MTDSQHQAPVYHKLLQVTLALLLLSGCSTNPKTVSKDILTQKEIEKGRTPITVLVKYAFTINEFEKKVEEKFPDIDIIQVGNYTKDRGIEEIKSRMKNDDLTDLIMTWPMDAGSEYCEDRLLDLSGMEFSSRYNLSMLNTMSQDGKLYYLPGPSQVRGIVYNQTLFEENGWKVPTNYDGFVSLCQTIEASGIRALQLGFANSEVLDTAFVGYNYGAYYSKPEDALWLDQYNQGQGSFADHFSGALDTFEDMIQAGIWKKEDLDISYADRETMLFSRQCAMVEDSVLMSVMGSNQTGTKDQYALMPFFNPTDNSDWARLYMVCFVGANKHLAEPQNKQKYDLVMKILDYISTPEGQANLAADTGAMYSSLSNTSAPNIDQIQELLPALNAGRYAIFPELQNAQAALREGLKGMVAQTLTKEEVIAMVDQQNANPSVAEKSEVLGNAVSDFTIMETGNYVTDVLRQFSGCDFSLFLDNGKDGKYNGKGISARFYEGELTTTDIFRILPDLKQGETGTLWKVTMTGENLLNTLEYSISINNNVSEWFYYFSGLQMTYDPTAQPGTRIQKITTEKGEEIQKDQVYSIAVMDETVPEAYILSCEKTDVKIEGILKDSIRSEKQIAPSQQQRFLLP